MAYLKPLEIRTADGLKMEVVNYPELIKLDADVYLIFGMRSFGKSYGILEHCLIDWIQNKRAFVMMRTIDDDITQTKARKYIAALKNRFSELTNYEKELTVYTSDFIARSFGKGTEIIREKVGSVMSLSGWLKYKGNNYDDVGTIIFEEFLERRAKLSNDAFLEGYLNNLSTVIRLRQDVKVFCLANTVKKKSPIFDYYHIDLNRIKKGEPALFSESNGLRVCVYWTPDVDLEEQSVKHYTVSDTRQAKMITGGSWEEGSYPEEWEGFACTECMRFKRFRASFKFYLHDLGIYVWFPYKGNTPVLVTKLSFMTAKVSCTALHFATFYGQYLKVFRAMVLTGQIVQDGKSAEGVDYLMTDFK